MFIISKLLIHFCNNRNMVHRSHDTVASKPLFLSKWKGLISMPTFTKFVASARGVSGMADYMLEVCFN